MYSVASLNQLTAICDAPAYRSLKADPSGKLIVLPDGSRVYHNEKGQLIHLEYSTGAVVRRSVGRTIVRTAEGAYAIGSPNQLWHFVD